MSRPDHCNPIETSWTSQNQWKHNQFRPVLNISNHRDQQFTPLFSPLHPSSHLHPITSNCCSSRGGEEEESCAASCPAQRRNGIGCRLQGSFHPPAESRPRRRGPQAWSVGTHHLYSLSHASFLSPGHSPFIPSSLVFCSLIFPGVKLASDQQFTGFLEGLGPAQLAGRQTLATPPMGNYQSQTAFSTQAKRLLNCTSSS